MADDDVDAQFFAIANDLAGEEANDYLDARMQAVERWVARREARGEPADLRSFIEKVMVEPNARAPVIVAMCTAMWRLRLIQKGTYGDANS